MPGNDLDLPSCDGASEASGLEGHLWLGRCSPVRAPGSDVFPRPAGLPQGRARDSVVNVLNNDFRAAVGTQLITRGFSRRGREYHRGRADGSVIVAAIDATRLHQVQGIIGIFEPVLALQYFRVKAPLWDRSVLVSTLFYFDGKPAEWDIHSDGLTLCRIGSERIRTAEDWLGQCETPFLDLLETGVRTRTLILSFGPGQFSASVPSVDPRGTPVTYFVSPKFRERVRDIDEWIALLD
jgi:hypothetical protein